MAKAEPAKFITKSTVLQRGWSEKMIAELLGGHDQEAPNPHYKSGPPMKLYDENRVTREEGTKAFQAASAKLKKHSESRKAGAKRAVQTKAAKTAALIENAVITVRVIERAELIRQARAHQRSRQADREERQMMRGDFGGGGGYYDDYYVPTPEERAAAEEAFEQRITVNYIRHRLTEYDANCRRLNSLVGKDAAYRLLRAKVFAAIRTEYPWLADECDRQRDNSSRFS
jgi:hypothetical protein